MNRPNKVKRKLLKENRLVSRGSYQGTGESAARSFPNIIFKEKKTVYRYLICKLRIDLSTYHAYPYLKTNKFQSLKALIYCSYTREPITKLNFSFYALMDLVVMIKIISHAPFISSKTLSGF